MVQVSVRRGRELERPEANVVESFVVDAVGLIRILDQLMDGEGTVVRLHDRVRHL